MKDSSTPPKERKPSATLGSPPAFTRRDGPSFRTPGDKARAGGPDQQRGDKSQTSETEDDLYRRYEREQAIIQEELARLAKREREAAHAKLSSSILMEKNYTNQERRRAEHLAQELERKEAELKRLDSFHKEQLDNIKKKNLEIYRMTAEQFHTAATNAEYRVKKRSYDPVCLDLQSNILKCYMENQQERLNCSDVAKEYRRCVSAAQKDLLFKDG
ncbi:MICOS complex subunit MIC25 isoform 2-T2 [Discoglossus pictus]